MENILPKKGKQTKTKAKFGKLRFVETKELFLTWFTQLLCHGQ